MEARSMGVTVQRFSKQTSQWLNVIHTFDSALKVSSTQFLLLPFVFLFLLSLSLFLPPLVCVLSVAKQIFKTLSLGYGFSSWISSGFSFVFSTVLFRIYVLLIALEYGFFVNFFRFFAFTFLTDLFRICFMVSLWISSEFHFFCVLFS